jgi:hypothetical protein
MSQIVVTERSKPIEIPVNRYSYALPFSNSNKYLFELTLQYGKKQKIIRKIEESKTSEILSGKDKISFKKITDFKIKVYVIPDDNVQNLELIGQVDNDLTSFTKTNKKIYIEFIKNPLGFTVCTCTVVISDNFGYSISPPF